MSHIHNPGSLETDSIQISTLRLWPTVGGEMGRRIQEFDWSATKLGDSAEWPQYLKTAVDIILLSPVPMVLVCGADGVMIYNEAYAGFAGARHPRLLGMNVLEGWHEVADFNRDVLAASYRRETRIYRDQQLILYRNGNPEDVWLDLYYSPLLDQNGDPQGFLAVVVETTERILSERSRAEAQEALRQSEERLSLALEASQFPGLWDWDVVNDRLVASRRFAALYGVDPERARLGVKIEEFLPAIHPDDRNLSNTNRDNAIQFGGKYLQEYRLVQKDGSIRWVQAHGQAHQNSAGKTVRIAGVLVDITKERQALEELQKSEERHRLALEASQAFGTWNWDVPNDIVTADLRFGELFLMEPDQSKQGVPIASFFKAIHPDDLPRVSERIKQVLRDKTKYREEFRLLYPDGSVKWISVRGHVNCDAEGRPVQFPGVGVDVTAERQAIDALRKSEEFNRSILSSSPDCIKVLDLDGKLLSINDTGRRQMELDGTPCEGKYWPDLLTGTARTVTEDALVKARGGITVKFEAQADTAKGTPKWWEVIVTPVENDGSIPGRLLFVSRDITERKQIEEQLRQTAKLESLGVMAGGIAHDFNNLLTGILGNASLLADSTDAHERTVASEILNAAQRAAHLTKQMLAYSGKGRFFLQRMDLSIQAREILPLLKPLIDKTAMIELYLATGLPNIEADIGQVQQLIMNLAINAAEALNGKPGTVMLSTYEIVAEQALPVMTFAEGPLAAGRYVCFSVRDTGCGMSQQTIRTIFDPFFTTKFTGRGLGLSAVSGIVRGHKGGIRIASELGAGTLFEVLLPVAVPPENPEQKAVRKKTVLFVDDEEAVRRFARVALDRAGYAVVLATNGQEAIERLKDAKETVDVIVLDMMMPVMGGETAFNYLREVRRDVPILISSGYNEVEVIRRFTREQVAGFIQKPYTAAQLSAKIEDQLKG